MNRAVTVGRGQGNTPAVMEREAYVRGHCPAVPEM